jgi:peptide/nickel transport system substrate-binding protein
MTRQKFLGGILGFALVTVGTFIAGSASAQQDKHLTVIVGGVAGNLDPHLSIFGQALTVFNAMFDALTRFDANMRAVPSLATEWKILDDTTWRFKLRQGVKFHNGEDFDAEAVKFSLERILDPQVKSPNLSRLTLLAGVDIVDKYTVNIKTKGAFPILPVGLVWGFMVPPKYTRQIGNEQFGQKPIGTGPFKLQDWMQGQHVNLTRNPTYWRGEPKVNRLSIRMIPDPAVRISSLKAAEAQLIIDVPPQSAPEISRTPGLKVAEKLWGAVYVVNLDSRADGPLKDKRVRQALNYAADKEAILKHLLGGYGKVVDAQVVTPEAFGYNPSLKPYPHNPAKARQLLTEAGYPNGFEMTITSAWGVYAGDKEIIVALADQLAKVGVKAKLNNLEFGVFIQLTRAGQAPNFVTVWLNYGDARFALQHGLTKSNQPYWSDQNFDRLFAQSETTLDPKSRERILFDAGALMADQAPVIFLHQPANLYGASDKLDGWEPHFSGWLYLDKADLKR